MKTVKPFRVGAMTQTFELDKKFYLTAAILVCFELGDDPGIVPDVELWRRSTVELGALGVLDECQPKQRGEVLVNGFCFTANAVPRTGASVRLAIGSVDKTLYVIGDRVFRVDGTASDPTPFTKMPIGYERAFGGPGFPDNPVGVGAASRREGGADVHRLPNVEDPERLIKQRGDQPPPAGFGPYDRTWPKRWSKIGTYDMRWLKTEAPGRARDMDLSHFNTAPDDQQIEGYFRGDETFTLENMHPQKPMLTGRLPRLVGRCFLTQRPEDGGEPVFREVPTHLDTIRLFPHLELGLVVFHALARVHEDDADDVVNLLVGCDDLDAPRPAEHFRDVLTARLDRSKDRGAVLRDEDLVPARVLRKSLGGAFGDMGHLIKSEGHIQRNIVARMERENENTRASLVAAGVKPADVKLPPIPQLDFDVDAERAMREMEQLLAEEEQQKSRALREVHAAEARLREQFKGEGRDYDAERDKALRDAAGPPKFSAEAEMQRMRDIRQLVDNAGQDTSEIDLALEDPVTYERLRRAEEDLRESYRRTAHATPFAAARLGESERARVRQQVEKAHKEGLAFDRMDLTGANLDGIDLTGASFRGAFLESASLVGARLAGADFTGAVLARADLGGADLSGAKLVDANLGGARLVEANLSDVADFTGAILSRVDLSRATIVRSVFDKTSFFEATLDGVDLRGTKMKNAFFYKNSLPGARFAGAELYQCVFVEVDFTKADFGGASLERSTFVRVDADGSNFLNAKMNNFRAVRSCSFKGCDFRAVELERSTLRDSDLSGSDFSGSKLDSTDFGKARLADANFYRAVARRAHFVRADLSGARLVGANLDSSMFMNAKLARADFTGANLFQANFLRAKGDPATSFSDANVTRVFHGAKE